MDGLKVVRMPEIPEITANADVVKGSL